MTELQLVTEMLSDMRDALASQHQQLMSQNAELIRLNTVISIEIPAIKEEIKTFGEAEDRITTLERYGYENRQAISQIAGMQQNIIDLSGKVNTMSETVEAMKPIIQFFSFAKWLVLGVIAVAGWIGANATGIWDFISKIISR